MEDKTISYNNSIPTTAYLISHIHWLNKIRRTTKNPDIIQGINISIIILLCTYIEATLNELLGLIIKNRIKETEDKSYVRILNSTAQKLEKASWNQYLDIFKTLLPESLNHYVSNELWKGIKVLFSLRNALVHGKGIKSKLLLRNDEFEIEYSGVFKTVLDYFKEQKVLKSHQLKSSNHKILSIQSTNHFIKITDNFVDEMIFKLSAEQGLHRGEIFSFRSNIMKEHEIEFYDIYPNFPKKQTNEDDLPF